MRGACVLNGAGLVSLSLLSCQGHTSACKGTGDTSLVGAFIDAVVPACMRSWWQVDTLASTEGCSSDSLALSAHSCRPRARKPKKKKKKGRPSTMMNAVHQTTNDSRSTECCSRCKLEVHSPDRVLHSSSQQSATKKRMTCRIARTSRHTQIPGLGLSTPQDLAEHNNHVSAAETSNTCCCAPQRNNKQANVYGHLSCMQPLSRR
jgi:hypothetical protein